MHHKIRKHAHSNTGIRIQVHYMSATNTKPQLSEALTDVVSVRPNSELLKRQKTRRDGGVAPTCFRKKCNDCEVVPESSAVDTSASA